MGVEKVKRRRYMLQKRQFPSLYDSEYNKVLFTVFLSWSGAFKNCS